MATLTLVLAILAIADGLILATILAGKRTPGQLARVLAIAATLWFARLLILIELGLGAHFGVIHLVYLDLFVGIPIAALVLAAARTRITVPIRRVRTMLAVGACFAAVGAYATFIEPFRLTVETAEVPVPAQREGSRDLRVAILADLQTNHIGSHEREAIDRLMALRPHLILIPGDLFQGSREELDRERAALTELLGRLHAPGGVFAVNGDVDPVVLPHQIVRPLGIPWLENEVTTTRAAGRSITIGGLGIDSRIPRQFVEDLERRPGRGDIRIMFSHHPEPAERLSRESRIDLAVAGHTHGGQVNLPLIGPIFTASTIDRGVAAGGLHDLGAGQLIYVSRGVGHEHAQAPRVRFGAVPEVSLITFRG